MSDWFSASPYLLIFTTSVVAVTIFVNMKLLSKKKKGNKQEKFPRRQTVANEGPQSVLSGVKVVELATVVAVPSIGSMMARMGAEVVKVEGVKGDYWYGIFMAMSVV